MRIVAALVIALAVAACSAPPPSAHGSISEDDAALSRCRDDVAHANLNVHDVRALDFAIHDCPSLAALKAAIAAAPGYLSAGVSVEAFVRNRCDDPSAVFAGLKNPVCDQAPPLQ